MLLPASPTSPELARATRGLVTSALSATRSSEEKGPNAADGLEGRIGSDMEDEDGEAAKKRRKRDSKDGKEGAKECMWHAVTSPDLHIILIIYVLSPQEIAFAAPESISVHLADLLHRSAPTLPLEASRPEAECGAGGKGTSAGIQETLCCTTRSAFPCIGAHVQHPLITRSMTHSRTSVEHKPQKLSGTA